MLANLHPPLSAFPLALITVSSILELVNLFVRSGKLTSTIKINLGVSMLFVIATFYSGYYAAENASQTFDISDEVIALHHSWGRVLLLIIIPCFILKLISAHAIYAKRVWMGIYFVSLLAAQVLVIYTGFLGGELVFKHGAGVSAENIKHSSLTTGSP